MRAHSKSSSLCNVRVVGFMVMAEIYQPPTAFQVAMRADIPARRNAAVRRGQNPPGNICEFRTRRAVGDRPFDSENL